VLRGHGGEIDLLVTDLIMPMMSGRELASRLLDSNTAMRVIFVNGNMETPLDDLLTAEERRNTLRKPFSSSELAAKVREILDR
jgi:CheY-like chemotaxis protein